MKCLHDCLDSDTCKWEFYTCVCGWYIHVYTKVMRGVTVFFSMVSFHIARVAIGTSKNPKFIWKFQHIPTWQIGWFRCLNSSTYLNLLDFNLEGSGFHPQVFIILFISILLIFLFIAYLYSSLPFSTSLVCVECYQGFFIQEIPNLCIYKR